MKLRPEFELADQYYKRLYADVNVDQEFLRKAKTHIDLCEHILEDTVDPPNERTTVYYKEKTVLGRLKHRWSERAKPFGMTIEPQKLLESGKMTPEQIEDEGRKFLRSLHIASEDGPSEVEDSE